MELTPEAIQYMAKVVAALVEGTLLAYDRTNRCPECEEVVEPLNPSGHMIWVSRSPSERTTVDDVVIVIGCEGYWVVDPAAVGLPRNQWQDYRMQGTD